MDIENCVCWIALREDHAVLGKVFPFPSAMGLRQKDLHIESWLGFSFGFIANLSALESSPRSADPGVTPNILIVAFSVDYRRSVSVHAARLRDRRGPIVIVSKPVSDFDQTTNSESCYREYAKQRLIPEWA